MYTYLVFVQLINQSHVKYQKSKASKVFKNRYDNMLLKWNNEIDFDIKVWETLNLT